MSPDCGRATARRCGPRCGERLSARAEVESELRELLRVLTYLDKGNRDAHPRSSTFMLDLR